jgi:cytochrome c peroxidase
MMPNKSTFLLLLALAVVTPRIGAEQTNLDAIESLGRQIFFDQRLSNPPGQSCAACHHPSSGWTGDTSAINAREAVYHGAVDARSGNRKPPSAAYATQSPVFHYDPQEALFIGGNFWDGRATGWLLGDPAAEQAQGPFLNPLEQNIESAERLVALVCDADYGEQLRAIYGEDICSNTVNAYNAIGKAISAYEGSAEVNAFSSKYDYYLQDAATYPLTPQELLGLKVFEDPAKGNCAACHPSRPGADGSPPLFTDYTFDNLGVPKNPENSFYGMPTSINPQGRDWVDPGLAGFLAKVPRFAAHAAANLGKHKVPTLRNVDRRPGPDFVKAYGHNGYFKSLKEIVHFYNTRDLLPACSTTAEAIPGNNCWPAPEVRENLNTEELGKLGLSEEEEWALVAFMQALSDGWSPTAE